MSIRKQFSLSAIGALGSKLIQFIVFIILARLLSPEDFGTMAILMILSTFSRIFIEMGLGTALIHNQRATKKHYATASLINIVMGMIFTFLAYISAHSIAIFYENSQLELLIKIFSTIFILNALSVIPSTILQKKGDFKSISASELISLFSASCIAIYMAIEHYGIWSLIVFQLFNAFLRWMLFAYYSQWVFSLSAGKNEIKELWKYIKYVLGSQLLNFSVNNLDTMIIGKVSGTYELGLYNTAFRLISLPQEIIRSIFNRVLISKYAKHQSELHIIRAIHLKTSKLVAFFTFPINIGLILFANSFVILVFGEKWSEMSYILQLFAIISFFKPLGVINSTIYLSQGQTKLQFYVNIFLKSTVIPAILVGSFWGVYGILYGMLAAAVINFYPNFYFSSRIIGLKVSEVLKNLMGVIIPLSGTAFISSILKQTYFVEATWTNFIAILSIYLLLYILLVYNMNKAFFQNFLSNKQG